MGKSFGVQGSSGILDIIILNIPSHTYLEGEIRLRNTTSPLAVVRFVSTPLHVTIVKVMNMFICRTAFKFDALKQPTKYPYPIKQALANTP